MRKLQIKKLVPLLPPLVVTFIVYISMSIVLIKNLYVWFDESFTAYLVRGNFAGIIHYTTIDVHPPLYYFLLKIWSLIFGSSLPALRAHSVVFGALSIVLLYKLLQNLGSGKCKAFKTTLVLILVAASPLFLLYATQVRMYSMNIFLSILSILLAVRIEQDEKITNRHWTQYTLVVVAMMYTHYYLALIILAEIIWLVIVKRREVLCRKLLIAVVGAVVAYAPWIPTLLKQIDSLKNGSWQPKSTLTVLGQFLNEMFFFYNSEISNYEKAPVLHGLIAFALLLGVVTFALKFARTRLTYLLLLVVVVPPIFCYIVNMFIARYLLSSVVCLPLLAGIVLLSEGNFLKFIPAVFLMCVLPLGYPKLFTVGTNSAPAVIKQVLDDVRPEEVVLAEDYVIYMDFAAYESASFKVYLDAKNGKNEDKDHGWPSLEMLEDNNGEFKVRDPEEFVKTHEKVLVVDADKMRHLVNGEPVK
ncbi:MAG: glycosyltransferase family 39 protein [Candidatus Ancillula trichonymphae]|nr:glycosyltransferase family 39 protein [Candidatus Ancillula trichonymphae]